MIASRRRAALESASVLPNTEGAPAAPDEAAGAAEAAEAAVESDESGWHPGRIWRLLALTVLLLAGAGYLLAAWKLEVGTVEQPDIGIYPRAAGLLFVIFLALVLVRELRSQPGTEPDAGMDDGGASVEPMPSPPSWVKPMVVLGAVLFYVLTVQLLGHIVSGAVVMAIVLRVAGQRAWWKVLGIAALCSVVTYALIAVVLGLPLPVGRLGLEF